MYLMEIELLMSVLLRKSLLRYSERPCFLKQLGPGSQGGVGLDSIDQEEEDDRLQPGPGEQELLRR